MLGQARLIGAGVFGVAYPVSIGVGATSDQRGAGFIGRGIGLIGDAIAILISLARYGTAVAFGQSCFVGAGVLGVRKVIAVSVRAAVRSRSRFVWTGIGLLGHPIVVSVRFLNGLHVDRGLGTSPSGVEGPGDQGVGDSKLQD